MNFREHIRATAHALLPNCREAVRAQSDALERPATLGARLGLWLHLLMCKWCRRYGQQIRFLRTAAHAHEDEGTEATTLKLSSDARERIKRCLQEKH